MSEFLLSEDDLRRIRGEWKLEAEEKIQATGKVLAKLELQVTSTEHLRTLMRELHCLKGMASMVGFTDLAQHLHALESYVELFQGKQAIPIDFFSLAAFKEHWLPFVSVVEGMNIDEDPYFTQEHSSAKIERYTRELIAERNRDSLHPELEKPVQEPVSWNLPSLSSSVQIGSHSLPCQACPYVGQHPSSHRVFTCIANDLEQITATIQQLKEAPLILIVDDEPDVARVVSDLILDAIPKARIVEAASGQTALNLLDSVMGDQIDLAIVDLSMPGMSGLELLTRMQKLRSEAQIFTQSMIMTGFLPNKEMWAEVFKSGARHLLLKPFGLDELLQCLQAPLREALIARATFTMLSTGQRIFLAFNRLERESEPKLQETIRKEIHKMLLRLNQAQKDIAKAQSFN